MMFVSGFFIIPAIPGLLIGLFLGFVIASTYKKNRTIFALVGAIAGGLAGAAYGGFKRQREVEVQNRVVTLQLPPNYATAM